MKKSIWLLLVLVAVVAGCESKYKDPDPTVMGYSYYPLEKGQYRVYQVTDTKYANSAENRQQFQLRERIDTSFVDQTGQLVYKVVRSVRAGEQSAWLDDSVMTVAKNDRMVVLTKDNTRFVKLVFPVQEGLEFIGDIYNIRQVTEGAGSKVRNGKEVYTYAFVGESYEVGSQVYPKTATVLQNFMSDDFKSDDRNEVYAEDIGLVHRVFRRLSYEPCPGDAPCGGSLTVESGHEREEILIEHGKL